MASSKHMPKKNWQPQCLFFALQLTAMQTSLGSHILCLSPYMGTSDMTFAVESDAFAKSKLAYILVYK